MKISIVLPCYKEGKNIYRNISFLQDFLSVRFLWHKIEFICVNDGSPDNTYEELTRLGEKYKNVTVVHYDENRGKGYAIMRGLRETTGDIIAFYDSDLDITPACLHSFIYQLVEDVDTDMIIGSKVVEGSHRDVSLKRKILSSVNMSINSILFELPVKDTQVGLKVFTKEVKNVFLYKVKTYSYAFDVDMLYHVGRAGLKIVEKPVDLQIAEDGSSGVNLLTMMVFLKDLFILYKRIHKRVMIENIKFKTKCKICLIKVIIFPVERILALCILLYKTLKNNSK